MENPAIFADALDRVRTIVHSAVKDLSPQELVADPKPHIAWLVWHMTRVQDHNISELAGLEQAWIADGWHARLGMPPESKDYASGHRQTPELVNAFSVSDPKILLAYFDAVMERTKAYLSTLSAHDLERVLDEPRHQPLPTVAVRLVSVIADNMRHAGQVEYLRGFIKHQGWFPAVDGERGNQGRSEKMQTANDEKLVLLLRQAGIEPDGEDLERFRPLMEQYLEKLKVLHSIDLRDEEIAPCFHPEWTLKG